MVNLSISPWRSLGRTAVLSYTPSRNTVHTTERKDRPTVSACREGVRRDCTHFPRCSPCSGRVGLPRFLGRGRRRKPVSSSSLGAASSRDTVDELPLQSPHSRESLNGYERCGAWAAVWRCGVWNAGLRFFCLLGRTKGFHLGRTLCFASSVLS